MRGMPDVPQLPGVTHEFVDAGGLRTHVALAGPEDAPPLLLVHGWPQHWWCWRAVIPSLAERWRVIAPDLRGHGWTDAPPRGYEKEQLADDLLALLDALGLEKVTWVGHDWGSWVGYLTALRAPERLERLVACSAPPPFADRRDPRTAALMLSYQAPISTPGLGALIVRRGMAGRLLRAGRRLGRFSDEEVRTFDDVLRARPHVTVQMYRSFLTRELPKLLRGRYHDAVLEVPTLTLLGDRDLVTRTVPAGRWPGQPSVTVERVEDVGHFLPEEAPEALLARL